MRNPVWRSAVGSPRHNIFYHTRDEPRNKSLAFLHSLPRTFRYIIYGCKLLTRLLWYSIAVIYPWHIVAYGNILHYVGRRYLYIAGWDFVIIDRDATATTPPRVTVRREERGWARDEEIAETFLQTTHLHRICCARLGHSHGQSISLAACVIARARTILYVLHIPYSYQFPADQTFNTPSDFTVYRNTQSSLYVCVCLFVRVRVCRCVRVCSAHRHKWWTTTDL